MLCHVRTAVVRRSECAFRLTSPTAALPSNITKNAARQEHANLFRQMRHCYPSCTRHGHPARGPTSTSPVEHTSKRPDEYTQVSVETVASHYADTPIVYLKLTSHAHAPMHQRRLFNSWNQLLAAPKHNGPCMQIKEYGYQFNVHYAMHSDQACILPSAHQSWSISSSFHSPTPPKSYRGASAR